MTTFARKLSVKEEAMLEELAESDDAVVRRRARSILVSMKGRGTHQIAEELGWSERSVRNAVSAFNVNGRPDLYHPWSGHVYHYFRV